MDRIRACLPVFHTLVHIPQSIILNGPLTAYSQYPMERMCGMLEPMVKSGRNPYENLANSIDLLMDLYCLPIFNASFIIREIPKNDYLNKRHHLTFPPWNQNPWSYELSAAAHNTESEEESLLEDSRTYRLMYKLLPKTLDSSEVRLN